MFEVSKLKNTALSFLKTAFFSLVAVISLGVLSHTAKAENYNNSLWDNLRYSFKLEDEYQRPEVQDQVNWLMNHKSYLGQLGKHSQPYLYYILQEVKKRNMPGEIALLPMIESTYNPFAYSHSGAAGLWQFTSGTGKGFGLKQNWWFDGRRDIYNSTDAALNYLSYLHRFFNGNWMLAIAAYHSGEGTVQHAMKSRNTGNFWALNLPQDTHSYVPKLLALAKFIQTQSHASTKLPYISNTPYFTKVNVGTQIDLTNAAHLAGLSYPEFLKLNPGNNRWATSPTGPHTIVLPLNKVDIFVHNVNKIPEQKRSALLAKHAVQFDTDLKILPEPEKISIPEEQAFAKPKPVYASAKVSSGNAKTHKVLHITQKGDTFWHLAQKYHVSEHDIRAWNNFSANAYIQPGQKLTIWTPNNLTWATSGHSQSIKDKMIYHTIRLGDSLSAIAHKYNVSVQKLLSWNTKLQPTRLIPGKHVLIYV